MEVVQANPITAQTGYVSVAARYCHHIITRHVFNDGNKRTGMACGLFFLAVNGIKLAIEPTDDEIVEIALRIAKDEMDLESVISWFAHIVTG